MQIIYTTAEVKQILLDFTNSQFHASFDDVVFDGYSVFRTATLELAEKPAAAREVSTKADVLS